MLLVQFSNLRENKKWNLIVYLCEKQRNLEDPNQKKILSECTPAMDLLIS